MKELEGMSENTKVNSCDNEFHYKSTKSIMVCNIATVEGTQAEGKKETMHVEQVIKFSLHVPSHLWNDAC